MFSSDGNAPAESKDKNGGGQSSRLNLEYLIVNYRWVFVCFFLLPLSIVYDAYFYLRNWVTFRLKSAPKKHDTKVRCVQRQVKSWRESGTHRTMCTARPGWQTMSPSVAKYKKTSHLISVDLVDILEVNIAKKTIKVEPLVTMGQITATLVPLGWTLPIVPELDDLTVGGMINGTGLESSSHIYGLFQHTCLTYKIVLHDGQLVTCSEEENTDLFHAIPWSHGTLGFLVCAELRIVPCKPFVRLEYVPLRDAAAACNALIAAAKRPASTLLSTSIRGEDKIDDERADFVEVIMFSKESGVLMLGWMTDRADPDKVNHIGRFYKPWFYTHVESFLSGSGHGEGGCPRFVEYIPLRDYYHRHTRSLFWMIGDIVPFGNSALFRFIFGWTMPPKVSFLKLTQGETIRQLYERHQVIQDHLIPINRLEEFLAFVHDAVNIYPIWVCPLRLFRNPGMVRPMTAEDMYADVGIFGRPGIESYEAATVIRKLEAFDRRINGYQLLYADTYMTEVEFRQSYDHSLYDRVRRKLGCEKAFPEVYQKICKQSRH